MSTTECPLLSDPFPCSVFVTGTGTDVGKTIASAFLCTLWEAQYWKPIQTGSVQDALEILRLSPSTAIQIATYHLEEPASPHWAAQLEGISIEIPVLLDHQPDGFYCVVEGAGGPLVPLNDHEDMLDLASALNLPMVVVASTRLGTLHHTLATVHSIRQRGVRIAGVLLNGPAHGENARQIRDRGQVCILGRLPEMFPLDAHSVGKLAQLWAHGGWVDPCTEPTPVAPKPSGPLAKRDAQVIWHPFTQHQGSPAPLEVDRAHGALLHTSDGQQIIDAISSWWVTNHGHTHPRLARAVGEQAKILEQVIFAGCTHEPAVQLAERLLPKLPGSPSRLFFSDDGSTSVEVALKACVQMARRRGVQNPRIAAFQDAYHGDTLGAMSAGARSTFSFPFESLLFQVDRIPTPGGCWDPSSPEALHRSVHSLVALESWAREFGSEAACLIVEPLVQGSAGMRFYPRAFLEGLDRICAQFKIPWIADEVFTGFGRTGQWFACSGQPTLSPSAICLSKGLTGGMLPLGVTAFREEVFTEFLSDDRSRALFHGHSFTGNPLGCAVALASLDLLEQPETAQDWSRLEAGQRAHLAGLAQLFPISGARVLGTIAAFELPQASEGYLASRGQEVARLARQRGVLLRPLGDTIYVMPPWCIRDHELAQVYEVLEDVLESLS